MRCGRGLSLGVHNEVTAIRRSEATGSTSIAMDYSFSSKTYRQRSRSYALALLTNVGKEVACKFLPAGK